MVVVSLHQCIIPYVRSNCNDEQGIDDEDPVEDHEGLRDMVRLHDSPNGECPGDNEEYRKYETS